jgi:hypothetical protein
LPHAQLSIGRAARSFIISGTALHPTISARSPSTLPLLLLPCLFLLFIAEEASLSSENQAYFPVRPRALESTILCLTAIDFGRVSMSACVSHQYDSFMRALRYRRYNGGIHKQNTTRENNPYAAFCLMQINNLLIFGKFYGISNRKEQSRPRH